MQSSLSEEAISQPVKPFSAEEIQKTMFAIDGEKAPGLDGYTAHFFKEAWSIVGEDVTAAILFFFQTRDLHPGFNSTIVALVPKCQNARRISEYRPISCCSVIYKCITKLLANINKKFRPGIISNCQSAFLSWRSIFDNILMVQELVRGYARSSLSTFHIVQ